MFDWQLRRFTFRLKSMETLQIITGNTFLPFQNSRNFIYIPFLVSHLFHIIWIVIFYQSYCSLTFFHDDYVRIQIKNKYCQTCIRNSAKINHCRLCTFLVVVITFLVNITVRSISIEWFLFQFSLFVYLSIK
jgi:hypothetical protein